MTDEGSEKRVGADEHLSRFILHRNHLREDWTVKPDAFIPHPWPDLSVTRRLQLSEADLWNIGGMSPGEPGKPCVVEPMSKRSRSSAMHCEWSRHRLQRIPTTPTLQDGRQKSHAQKLIAQEIAAAAGKARAVPPHSE